MKLLFSEEQARHDPQGMMIRGKLVAPMERPERLKILIETLAASGHQAQRPDEGPLDPVLRIHDAAYVQFLETAHAEWCKLPDASVDVLPNKHHYRGVARPGQPPGRIPSSIVGRAGWFVSDLGCAIGSGTWPAVLASVRSAMQGARLVAGGEASAFAI